MSKSKEEFKKGGLKKTIFQIMQERSLELATKAMASKGAKAVALVLLSIVAYHVSSLGHAMTAALYIFANDGKVSGRMSGDVKMRNGRQRAFTVPSLVRNVYTSNVRARFQAWSSSYRGLTHEQIASWVNAIGFTYIDRFAVSHTLKGKGLYMRLNINLQNAGQSPIADAPLATGVAPEIITSIITSVALSNFEVAAEDIAVPLNTTVLVFATTSLNAGISRPQNSAFRQITTLAAASVLPVNIWVPYVTKFGSPIVGATVYVRFIAINNTTGEASAISQGQAVILA